jgi:RNA polymerase sigma factor (sigma-70 family)
MAGGQLDKVVDHLSRLAGQVDVQEPTDRQLLERFLDLGDELAFEALLRRHGAAVLGVCRRALRCLPDAEDAFQATFLVLALKGHTIRKRESVGSWLYGVACRVARRARASALRRRALQQPLAVAEEAWDETPAEDLREVLDEELEHLPEKYRAPLVLCYLEGKTNEQAAQELGWRPGSMSRRLARARELLRGRLLRRGVAPAVAATMLPAGEAAAVPLSLAVRVMESAKQPGAVNGPAGELAKGVMRTMFVSKWQSLSVALLGLTVLAGGAGLVVRGASGQAPERPQPPVAVAAPAGKVAQPATQVTKKEAPASVAFSPDGKLLAVGSKNKILLRDTATGKTVRELDGAKLAVVCVQFSPDGRLLASAGGVEDPSARLWDVATGKETARFQRPQGITSVAFSSDAGLLATAGKDGPVALLDVATGRELRRLGGPQDAVTAVAFSPGGQALASASDGREEAVCFWDLASGKLLWKAQDQKGRITAVAVLPDGQHVVSGSANGRLLVHKAMNGERVQAHDAHRGGVVSVAVSADAKRMASAGRDGKVRLWDVPTATSTTLPGDHPRLGGIAFSPNGRLLAFASGNTVRLWDVARGAEVQLGQ